MNLVLVENITRKKGRKQLLGCWTGVGNIPLFMRIMKETGCLLGMSLGSKHLTTMDLMLF